MIGHKLCCGTITCFMMLLVRKLYVQNVNEKAVKHVGKIPQQTHAENNFLLNNTYKFSGLSGKPESHYNSEQRKLIKDNVGIRLF
jgi:hypothetical protein